MKNYLQNSLIKLRKVGERIASSSILSDTSWLLMSEDDLTKIIYIFKSSHNELYISLNGNIKKGKWEYIVDSNSLVIETEEGIELYNASLLKNDFLFLQKDGDIKSLAFANFTKYKDIVRKEIFNILHSLNEPEIETEPEIVAVEGPKQVPETDADKEAFYVIILVIIIGSISLVIISFFR